MNDLADQPLPQSWTMAHLADVSEINPGLDKSEIDDRLEVSFVPMPAVEAESGRMDVSTTRRFGDVKKGYTAFSAGDVLFAKITPCMENGKMAVVPTLKNGIGFGSTEFHVVRPRPGISARYLYYFLSAQRFRRNAEHNMTGAVGQRRVPLPYLARHEIPVPPENEQRRIVAKIEELFSELDKGVDGLTMAREQLKAYRQSAFKAAFEGKLTKKWRAKTTGHLSGPTKLEAELKDAGSVNAKRVPAQYLQDAATLPAKWAYFRVASLCSVVRGGSPRPAGDPRYYDGHIPFLKVADLTHATGMHLSTHTSTIKEAGLTKTRMTPPNTLLISNSGATLGVPKICTFETTFNDGVAAFLGIPEGYLEYFYFFWESQTAKLRGIDQGAAQPNLNTSLLGETFIPICSENEASTLVALLKALISIIERQSEEIDRILAQAAALKQAILKKAFSGQLVSQDPADEPASVQLKRMRAHGECSGNIKRGNNKNGKKEAA